MSVPYDSSVCLSPATPGVDSNADNFKTSDAKLDKSTGSMVLKMEKANGWCDTTVLTPPDVTVSKSLTSPNGTGVVTRCGSSSKNEETCHICGDRASGYHYNALSCEGCKGFFRRSIMRSAVYQCKDGGNCEMDMWMRRRCQACRLRRCREMGMKEECLLSDEQCKARDVRRKARQRAPTCRRNQRVSSSGTDDFVLDALITPPQSTEGEPGTTSNPLDRLSPDASDLIRKLVHYQDMYELPKEDDYKNVQGVKVSDLGRPKEMSEQVYQIMASMTILVTQLVVEFAKNVPGFSDLERDDQITLLKGSSSEVMILRTARRYDLETDTVVFAGGTPFTCDSMRYAGLGSYADSLFTFCRGMATLGVDNAEYALLTSLCIAADRPGLLMEKKVCEMQERFVNALLEYEKYRRPQGPYLARLLMKLTLLRQLSIEHSDVLSSLKVERGSLPPLLSEYFDIVE